MAIESIVSTILWVVLGLLGFILIITVGIIMYFLAQYKHIFVRKDLTGDKPFKVIDKAREIYDKKTGVYYWKLLKAKQRIGRPPNEAIHPTEKGNYFVEAYYLGDMNYIFSQDNLNDADKLKVKEIATEYKITYKKGFFQKLKAQAEYLRQKDLFKLFFFKPSPVYVYTHDYKNLDELKKNNTTINSYKAISTNQRLIAYDQIKEAYEKKINGLAQYLPIAVGVVGIIVLVAIVLIFGGELITPIANLGSQLASQQEANIKITNTQADITNMLAQIIDERQILKGEPLGTVGLLNKTAPN